MYSCVYFPQGTIFKIINDSVSFPAVINLEILYFHYNTDTGLHFRIPPCITNDVILLDTLIMTVVCESRLNDYSNFIYMLNECNISLIAYKLLRNYRLNILNCSFEIQLEGSENKTAKLTF